MFVVAVGLSAICMLVFLSTGYLTKYAGKMHWRVNFQRKNLSASDNLKSPSDSSEIVTDTESGSSAVSIAKPLLLLYWNKMYHPGAWWGEGAEPLNSCPELAGQCEFTNNNSRVDESDLLLFHMRDGFQLPEHRTPHQKWVFAVREAPIHTPANLARAQGLFNLTMTYANTAQVEWVYGRCKPLSPTDHPIYNKTVNYAAKKSDLVAWFVSHCQTQSRRETYVQALSQHVNVHKHGCGGTYTCPRTKDECYGNVLNDKYKFYLSFENSLCRDYVSEKLWRILELNVVPIVLGNASYSDLLPLHSYIDVRDFASPRHLADYLKLLDGNDALYNEYFRWKSKYVCWELLDGNGCNICRHALAKRGQTELFTDVVTEWSKTLNCMDPKDFYQGMDKYL